MGTPEPKVSMEPTPEPDRNSQLIPGESVAASALAMAVAEEPKESKLVKIRRFLYDRSNGRVLGRGGLSWCEAYSAIHRQFPTILRFCIAVQIFIFYVLYYFFVFTYFMLWIIILIQTSGDYKPGITQTTFAEPVIIDLANGLSFFPIAPPTPRAVDINERSGSETIYYDLNTPESSQVYADRLDKAVQASNYSFDDVGTCTQASGYGYKDGKPCFLIRFNHVFDWVPIPMECLEPYVKATYNPDHPTYRDTLMYLAILKNVYLAGGRQIYAFMRNHVGIECTTDSSSGGEQGSLGTVTYFPEPGIPVINFKEGIELQRAQLGNTDKTVRWNWSPYVFVQLASPARNRLIHVICKAFEQNMDLYFSRQGVGAVRFTVYIADTNLPPNPTTTSPIPADATTAANVIGPATTASPTNTITTPIVN